MSRFFDCSKHGWSALGIPCPKCKAGDAPTICHKHGWAAVGKPCPKCANGEHPIPDRFNVNEYE